MSDMPAEAVTSVGRVPEALGQSEAFMAFQALLSRVARVDRPVLLIGERGTGKELAARRLHYLSGRWERPLVALNCAALTPSLIESELFGYEAGAFTGAVGRRAGRFETADGGTLFLDEIASIPLEVQEKILRVVEYGTFERVGSAESIEVDVRIVGATNADLMVLASEGKFKQDLLDRLSFEVLFLPPLREREGDVLRLAEYFASRMAHELGREDVPGFAEAAASRLLGYGWPGNIRELKNVVERAVYRADGPVIEAIDFRPFRSPFAAPAQAEGPAETAEPGAPPPAREPGDALPDLPLEEAVHDLQVGLLKRALVRAKYNQRRAAEQLGLTYHQFRGLYRKFQDELT